MGLFTTKPLITQEEAKKARNELANIHDFSTKELAYFDQLIKPHLDDSERFGEPKGVSPEESEAIEDELDQRDTHRVFNVDLPDHKKEAIKQVLDKYLKK